MCFGQGQAKSTYGTGCFLLYNTGTAVRIFQLHCSLQLFCLLMLSLFSQFCTVFLYVVIVYNIEFNLGHE
jgi:hypothetical protein